MDDDSHKLSSTPPPELLPCPFCGGKDVETHGPYGWYYQWGITHSCKSFYSGAQDMFQGFHSEADAIAAWNTRPALAARSNQEATPELTPANRDCLAKARPGEPMFIILGRDPDGGNIVRLWAQRRFEAGDTEHAGPVFAIADAMDAWRAAGNLPESAPDAERYAPVQEATRTVGDAVFDDGRLRSEARDLRKRGFDSRATELERIADRLAALTTKGDG